MMDNTTVRCTYSPSLLWEYICRQKEVYILIGTLLDLNCIYYSNHCPLGIWLWYQRCKFPTMVIYILSIQINNDMEWLPEDFVDSKSTLIQVMCWCRHLSYHYLISCWQSPEPRSMCQLAGQSLAMVINDTGELWCGIFTEAQMTSRGWY